MSIVAPSLHVSGPAALFADVLLHTERIGECICWTRALDTQGYGQIARAGVHYGVHRIAYVWRYGEIAPGLVVDHVCHDPHECVGRCHHRRCVNPDHLVAVTNEQNLKRQGPAFKSHCVNGHERTLSNLGRRPDGRPYCRPCNQARAAALTPERRQFTAEVRAWAVANGHHVSSRGVLPKVTVEAWDAAFPDRPYWQVG